MADANRAGRVRKGGKVAPEIGCDRIVDPDASIDDSIGQQRAGERLADRTDLVSRAFGRCDVAAIHHLARMGSVGPVLMHYRDRGRAQ